MSHLMNHTQYKKACRYRMRETLENLESLWNNPEALLDNDMIDKSLDMLNNALDELKYFREKLDTTEDGQDSPQGKKEPSLSH